MPVGVERGCNEIVDDEECTEDEQGDVEKDEQGDVERDEQGESSVLRAVGLRDGEI